MYFRRKKGAAPKPKKKFPYAGIKFASKKEMEFAQECDRIGITWFYEPEKWDWVPPKKKYTPDFKVARKDGSYFFVEYKGYLRPEDRTKMRAIKKQYPDLDIRFVFQNAKKPISKTPKKDGTLTTYADWAENLGFPWAEAFMPAEWLKEEAA